MSGNADGHVRGDARSGATENGVAGVETPRRILGFDLLRGLAALAVAIPHLLLLTGHSDLLEAVSIIAVEVFFALSGYVLAPQVLLLHARASAGNFGVFLFRRWIRTLVPYVIALVLIAWLTGNLFTSLFLQKTVFVDTLVGLPEDDFFAISWSLAVEEWYYVLAAVLAVVFARTRLMPVFVGVLVVSFAVKLIGMALDPDWLVNVRRVAVYRLDAIAFGFVMYLLRGRLPRTLWVALAWLAVSLAVSALLLSLSGGAEGMSAKVWMLFAIYALTGFSVSSVAVFRLLDPALSRLRLLGVSEFLGRISYSVYLFHLPFGYALAKLGLDPLAMVVLGTAMTVAFSWSFAGVVESRLIGGRPRYRAPGPRSVGAERVTPDGPTVPGLLRGMGVAVAGLVGVVALAEVGSQAWLKRNRPALAQPLFHTDENLNKRGTIHALGALDPMLGYAHPKRIAIETKPFGVSPIDGFGVHRAKQGDYMEIFTLGGSTSDPFLAARKKEFAWTYHLYTNCRRVVNCQVWNGGVGGFGSPQEVLKLVRDVVPREPDLVVSLHGPNELNRLGRVPFTTGEAYRRLRAEAGEEKLWLDNYLPNLLSAVAWIRREDDTPARDREIHWGYNYNDVTPFQRWKTNVEMMHGIAASQGVPYVTVLQPLVGWGDYEPSLELIKAGRRNQAYYDTVAEFYSQATEYCATVDFCLDMSRVFDGYSREGPEGELYRDIRHPNDAGNRIIGERVAEALVEMGLIAPLGDVSGEGASEVRSEGEGQ